MQATLFIFLVSLLSVAVGSPTASPEPGLLGSVLSAINSDVVAPVLDILALPPPTFLQTFQPSPQCANVNQGELLCCRATVAGDVQPVVWLASVYGYSLNPNDVNGLNCDTNVTSCPGTNLCCQVTFMVGPDSRLSFHVCGG
jgi:hypothetical protein